MQIKKERHDSVDIPVLLLPWFQFGSVPFEVNAVIITQNSASDNSFCQSVDLFMHDIKINLANTLIEKSTVVW